MITLIKFQAKTACSLRVGNKLRQLGLPNQIGPADSQSDDEIGSA